MCLDKDYFMKRQKKQNGFFTVKSEFGLPCKIIIKIEGKLECALVVKMLDQIRIRKRG